MKEGENMKMEQQKELRQNIENLIQKYGTTQAFIGSKVGVTRTTICLWLNDKKVLPTEVFENVKAWYESLN